MSDKPISVGDLVQVIGSHCGKSGALGIIRTVEGFKSSSCRCTGCGFVVNEELVAVLEGPAPWSKWHIPVRYLKRIPPLDELESEKNKEELTA